ncbi:hypothetical protein G6514_004843 [Epicoccum nigrum]|nr:hypothetical protein G6514_004843 [Epicoccum nigrum]
MAYTKNYYHTLGLCAPSPGSSSSSSSSFRPKSAGLRRAYRNALLAAHPDKKAAGASASGPHSVDDVKEAYGVLDDAARRAEYDNWVLRNPHVLSSGAGAGVKEGESAGGGYALSQDFVLGLELLDLSDFEERAGEAGEVLWTRGCRCGDQEGFRIVEEDLEDAEGRGEKEVLVGCGGCSLWVRVGFEVEEG